LIREIAAKWKVGTGANLRSALLESARLGIDAGRSVAIALGVERNRMRSLGRIGVALQVHLG
jgi:hypothetical protein